MSEFSLEIADASKAPCDFAALRMAAMIGPARDEKAALAELKKRCRNLAFAESATYALRQVETEAETDELRPSIIFMRAAAECLGSVHGGGQILRKFIETLSVRGWAYDAAVNRYKPVDDIVDCVLRRRGKGKDVKLDGSHLRARYFAIMACAERRALQDVLPAALVEKGFAEVLKTLERAERREIAKQGPDAVNAWLRAELEACDVTVEEVERKFGRAFADMLPVHRIELRAILKSLRAGESDVLDHFTLPEWLPPSDTPPSPKMGPEHVKAHLASLHETKPEPKPAEPKKPADVSGSDWRTK